MEAKFDKSEIEPIEEKISKMTPLVEFEKISNWLIPLAQWMETELEKVIKNNQQSKEIMVRFDEIISEKASKISLF